MMTVLVKVLQQLHRVSGIAVVADRSDFGYRFDGIWCLLNEFYLH
jgi:hypothetical protein